MNWQRLAEANTHPLRIAILEVLGVDGGRSLSPKDLSIELQAPLSTINYHVTELAEAGLLELVRERPVRGATEHFYRAADSAPEAENGHRDGDRPQPRTWRGGLDGNRGLARTQARRLRRLDGTAPRGD